MERQYFPAFRPARWLPGGHAQTLAGFFLTGRPEPYAATRHEVSLPDGDRIVLHDDWPSHWSSGGPTALLLHGICGDHQSPYVARAAAKLNQRGVRTFRMDQRCCGAGSGLARRPYHAGISDDTAAALKTVAGLCPGSPTTLVGYSMGGNIALKLAGESAQSLPENLQSVVAINPPIDLAAATANLERPINRFYDRYFMHYIARLMAPLREFWHAVNFQFQKLHEFNESVIARVWEFGSAARFYTLCSAAQFLPSIRVPALVIASRDDPIVPFATFEQARFSPTTRLVVTERGGHLGYLGQADPVDPDRFWIDWRVVDWVKRSLGIRKDGGRTRICA